MRRRFLFAISISFLLLSLGACSKAPKTYYPLAPGRTWTYQASMKNAFGEERNGTVTVTNLATRQLQGRTVTPQKVQISGPAREFSLFEYMAGDQSGVYTFANQTPADVEPKIKRVPDYMLKEPIKVGSSWSATADSPNGHWVTGEATIESTDEAVDVPAGSFKDCVKVHIVGNAKGATSNEQYMWFAPSVGLVKEVTRAPNTSGSLLLVSFRK
jgi:hypothetical protein